MKTRSLMRYSLEHNKQINLKKVYKWNSTVTCWKKIQDYNCRLNSSLRMGFGWWLYFRKKKEKPSELERRRWNKSQYHEVPTVSNPSLFLFRVDGACFFQPNNLKCNFLIISNQREKEQSKNRTRTLHMLTRLQ